MRSSVITTVVENDLCIGCGLCAALCPAGTLAMQWNRYGEYNPEEVTPCTTKCGLCLKVCPFADTGENEDTIGKGLYGGVPGINHQPETGYYLTACVGYSKEHRLTSASGGMATWLLETLLTESVVDHIICVAPTGDPEKLFTFRVFDTAEGVRTGAGSAYYPVELSAVIRHISEIPGRYAVTGLPCFIKAVRLAQLRNAKLQERVVVTVGLACGQLKSRHFTDYIAALAGVKGKVTWVCYRGKSPEYPASNYHYAFTTADGEGCRILWDEGIAEAWTNSWFTPKACGYCDDIFAECADVTCMDAWLSEYSKDYRGTNLLVTRSPLIQDLLSKSTQEGDIRTNPIPIQDVIRSQAGVVEFKRHYLAYRLHLGWKNGQKLPGKRVSPKRPKNLLLWREVIMKDRMRMSVRSLWIVDPNAERLTKKMWLSINLLAYRRHLINYISSPIRTIKNIGYLKNPGNVSKKNSVKETEKNISFNVGILLNARKPLNIPTYDGSNQVVHPSIIDFLTEYGLPQWGGYRFWMVITPYPYSNNAFENPSIYTSNDGMNWCVPPKIINPIDCAPGGWERGFNNDPDMVYDSDLDQIRVYFRFASTDQLKVKFIRITKEHRISEPIAVLSQSPWTQSDNTHRSFCIWRESSHQWHMWGGGGTETPPYNIYYRFSEDGINWGSPEKCVNKEGNDPFQVLGYTNWHISCKPNYCENRIEFLSNANPILSEGKGVILYAECPMSNPTLIRTPIIDPILVSSERGWDNGNLYRCSFIISDTGSSYYYRIWYSAESKKDVWKLGYTEGHIGNEHSNIQNTQIIKCKGEIELSNNRFCNHIHDQSCSKYNKEDGRRS